MAEVAVSPPKRVLPGARPHRSVTRRVASVLLSAILLVVLVVGGLYWQVTRHSVGLGFMRGSIENALRERLPANANVSVGSTAISYRDGQGVILRVGDLQLSLPGMTTVLVAELSTVTTASAVFNQRIDLQSVTVSGVAIGVYAPPRPAHDGSSAALVRQAVMSFVNEVAKADDFIRAAGLDEILVRDAVLSVADDADAPKLRIAEANWLPLGDNRSKTWLQLVEESGAAWDLTLERRRSRAGDATVVVEIEQLPVASLVPALGGADDGPHFRSAITMQARLTQAADGSFKTLRGSLSLGSGPLSLTGLDEIHIANVALHFMLGATDDRMQIPGGEITTHAGSILFEAVADLAEAGGIRLGARIKGGILPTAVGNGKPVRIVGGGLEARIDFAERGIDIERVAVMTPDGAASAIGQASLGGASPGLSFALEFDELPAETVRALWPPFIAAKTRQWFDANVKSGTLGPATIEVALPPEFIGPQGRGKVLPSYALLGTMPFRAADFSPIRTFPVVRNASGQIDLANATATIWAQTGLMEVPGRGQIDVAGTALIVRELGLLQQDGDLHLMMKGPASALAEVSNMPPLSIAAKRGIVPETLTGDAELVLDGSIPLYPSDFAGVFPAFRLTLTDFTSTAPIETRMIADADLVLEGTAKQYTVTGEGALDGLAASVDLIMGSEAPEQTAVTVTLDEEARERLGFGFGSLVTGPVQAALSNMADDNQAVSLDLRDANVKFPFLGWEKGPGVPATASFIMVKSDAGAELRELVVSGKGFEARGSLSIGTDGRVKEMAFDHVALRPGDQLTARATANGQGYDVVVRGAAFDARGIIAGVGDGLSGGSADIFPIHVDLAIDSVTGRNEIVLSAVAGSMTVTSKGLESVSLKGSSDGNQPFEWTVGRDGDTRIMRVFADNGGSLIAFSGVYAKAEGGNLVLDYSGPVGGAGSGALVMSDFSLIRETALEPALQTGTAREGMVHANRQTAGEVHFTQLRVPFRQEGWVITIDDATLKGSLLGATAGGTVNVPGDAIAISGTFIPAYGVNNIPAAIPLLGPILGGGRDEGLFGINYKLFGPLDGPQMVMNPLSAIAPGFFRKIFEYR